MITEFAPAKVNLALHVTGRRADGYHLLDSLVVFAGVGDHIHITKADALTLQIAGPQSASLPVTEDNLVLRAARSFGIAQGAAITLEKVLPIASGIGGGSADAAAALRGLGQLWLMPLPDPATVLTLGADVPVCLAGEPARMSGIGDVVTPLAHPMPKAWLVLVNPRIALSTPAVFAALQQRQNDGLPAIARWRDVGSLAQWLQGTRNDLEAPAIAVQPMIATVKAALAQSDGCLIARMSGSGATCFGLFGSDAEARQAANDIAVRHPDWWACAAPVLG